MQIATTKVFLHKILIKPRHYNGYKCTTKKILKKEFLPLRYDGDRNLATSIYFMLEGEQTSKFHRLKSDEQWHFYDGCPAKIYSLNENGELSVITLGNNISSGEIFQTVIKPNHWFAAELADKNSFCLVGCVVSPGFDFSDFELARREELLAKFSQHKELITKFTV